MTAIWTSSKMAATGLLILLLSMTAAGQVGEGYYDDSGSQSITGGSDTGFSVPQYESESGVLTGLVAPFIFLTLLLHFVLTKSLHMILRDEDYRPANPFYPENPPNVNRYSLLMSICITGALIPTAFWQYLVWAIRLLGGISLLVFGALVLFVLYLFLMA